MRRSEGDWDRTMRTRRMFVAGIVLCVIMAIVFPIAIYFGYVMPADTEYNQKFKSHVAMAQGQATFEGIRSQILVLWDNMNETFAGENFNTTYSSWWGPDQTYENSLAAQRDYFDNLSTRLLGYQNEYAKMLAGNTTTFLQDWYHQSIENARKEMNHEGGLDWALNGAFYLNLYPLAYWSFAYCVLGWVIIVPVAVFLRIAIP